MSLTDETTSWQSFSHLTATSDFGTLLQSVNDPKYQFLKGLSVFRPRQASNEGSAEAQGISKELGLDITQAEVLLKMIKTSSTGSDKDLTSRSKDLYFNERLALLRTIRAIFEEDYKGSCSDLASVVKTVKSFQSSGLVSSLLKELITQLTACSQNGVHTLKPLTAGDLEIECLVEILMYSFRKHPCLAGSLMELFKSIQTSLGSFTSSLELQIKLSLLPMLAFGFWQALENARLAHGRPLQHNLQSEFIELDGFFSLLAYGQDHPLETTLQLTWQVFRRFYSIASSKNGSDAPGGVYVGKMDASLMPGWIKKVLSVINSHTLSKECLLMMMSALMYYNSTFQDRNHCFDFFEVLSEILQNDYYLCERLFDCQTHWKLRKLFLQTKHWFCFSVYPLMTLLTAFSFPGFAPRISNLLSFDNFSMVILLKDSEFDNIQSDANSGRLLSTARIYPSLGTQMVVLQGTSGRIWEAESAPNWLIPILPQTQFVKWENYQFRTILLFKMHQLMIQTETGNQISLQIRQEAVLDAMSLVRFLSAYLRCSKETGMDQDLNLESDQLIQMIREWMGVFLEAGFEVSSLLYLLKDLAEEKPYQVLTAIKQSPLFLSSPGSIGSISIHRILSLQGFEDQLDQVLPVVDALLGLLSKLMIQGFQLEGSCNWVEVVWKELIPKLKMHKSISIKNEILLKLYISILRSVLPFFKMDNRDSGLRKQYLESLKTGFCLEDCVLGILELIPGELDQIKDLSPLQLELITNTCQVLSSLLEDPDLEEEFLTRIVQFLEHKGYWKTKSPAAVLLLYIMRAFRTSELTKEDSSCSASAIEFFSAFLSRLQIHGTKSKAEPVFLSSLPMVQQEVHPDFRKALVLESVFHGKEVNGILIKSAINLLITASKQDSEFFKFLVYPSKMDPGIESCDNSLLDVLFAGLQSSQGLYKTDPELLFFILKGISAVQNCKGNDRTSWEALIGQNEFNQCLVDFIQSPKINSIAEQQASREEVLTLSLQIIQKEVQDSPVNQQLTQKLPLDLRKNWKTWKQLLINSIQTPIIQQEDEKMLYVLANCACFEIYNSLKSEDSSFDCFPFMQEIKASVEEILTTFAVRSEQVVEYILEITTNVCSGLQLQHALLNPAQKFEFLSTEAMPGSLLLDLIVSCDSRWNKGRTGSMMGQEKVPKWIKVQFRTYRMLQEFLNSQFEAYFCFLPIRDGLLTHWRSLNRFILSSSSFEAALSKTKVKELVPEVILSLQKWLNIANQEVGWIRIQDDKLDFRSRGISQLCLKWSLCFIVNLSGILLDCVELLPVLSTASLEPSSSSSPAPSILIRQDSQIDHSFFDFGQILQILKSWFGILKSMKGQQEEQENQDSIQSGSKTLLLLIWIQRRNLSHQLSSLDSESSFQVILSGLLDLLDPRRFGFEVSNAAIGAMIGFSEFSTEWSEEILQTFHSEIQCTPLLEYIKQNQNLLLESPGFQSWSINFFRALEFVWNQRPLRKLFESEMLIEALWQYCQSLFTSEGQIQLDQPYSETNDRFGAFDHWLILLPLIGKILNVYFTPEQVIALHEPFYYSLLRLFDQVSVLLSSAFPSYLTLEFGNQLDPLTLARIERIEVNLEFALGTHDVLASRGVHCLQQYNLRRQEVSIFIQICDGILHRTTSRNGFRCSVVSLEEQRLDKDSLPFNIQAGWFGITKNRFSKDRIQSEETLSKFSWLLAKKVYLCLNKGMQYLKISTPLSNEEEEETGQDWLLSKDLLLRLQSDCLMICRNLVDSIGAGTDAVLRMEIRDLSRCLTSIVNLSNEFLTGWGYTRRRRYSEQFHTQLDVMHQLQLLVE